eukprot:CAMPEP_0183740866 /NCGR_PEP_ID=MMETSP0737-20130205/60720_1 /TAXON_ID=385413 /ORGANISM="Thalassiosira miniscula, Strain CCMP1093" /LENGTH=39 /DNA_ID= /DNA_START= /DNA_END= /DNA_ORIENTATION=
MMFCIIVIGWVDMGVVLSIDQIMGKYQVGNCPKYIEYGT